MRLAARILCLGPWLFGCGSTKSSADGAEAAGAAAGSSAGGSASGAGSGNLAGGGTTSATAGSAGTGGGSGGTLTLPGLCVPPGEDSPPMLGDVQPLFVAADAQNPPIVTTLADGTILTRGAGRVRNRQEKDETFNEYDPVYFEDRSFGFMVEDFTPTGMERIRVTYLPIYEPDSGNLTTNWRAWKAPGDNGTFLINDMMTNVATTPLPPTGPVTQAQEYDTTSPPESRSMAVGENLEFEFGLFIDPASLTTPGSRTSYHTDTFRYSIGVGGLTPNNTDYDQAPGPVPEARLGGGTTVTWLFTEQELYFSQMALNIQQENAQSFLEGRRLFNTDFVTGEHIGGGPAFEAQVGKAGPLWNDTACGNCHVWNGSGEALVEKLVFKLYDAADLGGQLRLQQGTATASGTETKTVTLGDGTTVDLSRPLFTVTATAGDSSHHSARLTPALIGVGLLEAVDELTILARADRQDCDGDGISGRPNFVTDPVTGAIRMGRLGWKAETVSVMQQVASEAALTLGVGNSLLPDSIGQVELDDSDLARLATYTSLLGVPPQRSHDDAQVLQGQALFESVGCASCHLTELTTGANHPFAELRSQTIQPFTDLLLHDMGADLADGSGVLPSDPPESPPSASEWRTPPLWGIGLRTTVNGHGALLHDGRAASVLEAVLWHGGEAGLAIQSFTALTAAERDALVAFVMSL